MRASIRRLALLPLPLVLWACLPSQPAPPPGDPDVDGAVRQVVADLARQVRSGLGSESLVVDPFLDRVTGQQTDVSRDVQRRIEPALGTALPDATVLPFDTAGAEQARLVATGTVGAMGDDRFLINVSLTDRRSGLVVAQSAARFVAGGLTATPTQFYADSPSLVRDRSVDGYLSTAQTQAGQPADPLYVEQIPTSALLATALAHYNAEEWEPALAAYAVASERADGQTLRTFNGLYLTNLRLERPDAAEEAFGKLVALGLATDNLEVMLLFRPGSTEFWTDRDLVRRYPMWLRQIGRAVAETGVCLEIVGHTSRTGSAEVNERLSQRRADAVRNLLVGEFPGIRAKLRTSGVGYRENIIGLGTDDARDALDRRVSFEVVPCPGTAGAGG